MATSKSKEEYTLLKEDILKCAAECPDARDALKRLCPKVFEKPKPTKVKVWEPDRSFKDGEILIRLKQESPNYADLMLVDKTGKRLDEGYILEIRTSGIHLIGDLDAEPGLAIAKDGAVKVIRY